MRDKDYQRVVSIPSGYWERRGLPPRKSFWMQRWARVNENRNGVDWTAVVLILP